MTMPLPRVFRMAKWMRVASVVATLLFGSRHDFESAKVDGGAVVLKKRDGGWLILPDTGRSALGVRNTIDAWLKSKGALAVRPYG